MKSPFQFVGFGIWKKPSRLNNYENNGYGLYEKDTFVDELADSLIRILDICGELKIDIESQVSWKMEKNKQREFMHGKNS